MVFWKLKRTESVCLLRPASNQATLPSVVSAGWCRCRKELGPAVGSGTSGRAFWRTAGVSLKGQIKFPPGTKSSVTGGCQVQKDPGRMGGDGAQGWNGSRLRLGEAVGKKPGAAKSTLSASRGSKPEVDCSWGRVPPPCTPPCRAVWNLTTRESVLSPLVDVPSI